MDVEVQPAARNAIFEGPPQRRLDEIIGCLTWTRMAGDKGARKAAEPRRDQIQIVSPIHLCAPSTAPEPIFTRGPARSPLSILEHVAKK